MVRPHVDLRHREILRKIDRQDLRLCVGGWVIKDPEKYLSIPEIASAIEDYKRQTQLAILSSTVSAGSSPSPQS